MLRWGFLILFGFLFCISGETFAQNSREIETRRPVPESSEKKIKQKRFTKKQAKKYLDGRYANYFDRLVHEYEDRMEANAKKNYRLAKELEKPRYSDPSYFGHKRPPKKRPPGKKRKCKECHMWH